MERSKMIVQNFRVSEIIFREITVMVTSLPKLSGRHVNLDNPIRPLAAVSVEFLR